jgi:hypothetical protein
VDLLIQYTQNADLSSKNNLTAKVKLCPFYTAFSPNFGAWGHIFNKKPPQGKTGKYKIASKI